MASAFLSAATSGSVAAAVAPEVQEIQVHKVQGGMEQVLESPVLIYIMVEEGEEVIPSQAQAPEEQVAWVAVVMADIEHQGELGLAVRELII
jgi:hypothetical protein